MRLPVYIPAPANPGASATATILDTGAVATNNLKDTKPIRVRVAVYTDAAATFYAKWAAPGSSNLRTFNNNGSGEAIAASTFFQRDVLMMPGRNQITITTGGAAPTVWEVGAEQVFDQALGQ